MQLLNQSCLLATGVERDRKINQIKVQPNKADNEKMSDKVDYFKKTNYCKSKEDK